MKTRILVGAVLAILLLLCLWLGGYFLMCTLTLLSLAAVYEVGKIASAKGEHPILWPVYLFSAVYVFVYYHFGFMPMACLYTICILAAITASVVDDRRTAYDAVFSVFLFIYPTVMLTTILMIYFSFPRETALTAAALACAAPEISDMFAYFGGTFFGKRKLCPSISPKKTVEGSYFAILGGVVFGAILIPLQKAWGGTTGVFTLLFTGFLCGIFAQIGDLFASKLKRWAEIKDFSSIFPGHGGVMDRIDSILVCAPIVLMIFTILGRFNIY